MTIDYITPAQIGDFSAVSDYWQALGYPVYARDELGTEGAQKRFVPFPTPESFRKIACFGLAQLAPQTYPLVTDDFLETYLTATITELEMQTGCSFTPTEYFESFDYEENLFANWAGLRLSRWPATGVLEFLIKFAHTQTSQPLAEYAMPPQWVALRNGKVNLLADLGVIRITQRSGDGSAFVPILGFFRGNHRPAAIELRYKAGFANDRMPAVVADWIISLATIRLLGDIGPMLFPIRSTSVSIDGVNQSTGLPGPDFLLQRLQLLKVKEKQQRMAIRAHFGLNIMLDFIGT